MAVIMKCGHTASAISSVTKKPICSVCTAPGHDEIDHEFDLSVLENREAKCPYCGTIRKSNLSLAFFEYRPQYKYDEFYCGCRGWD